MSGLGTAAGCVDCHVSGLGVHDDEGCDAEEEEQERGVICGGVIEVLDLIEEDEGEGAGGTGDVSAEHEDDAEFSHGVQEAEDCRCKQRAACEWNDHGANEAE